MVSRELVQLEDLLQWAESVHGSSHEDVVEATKIKDQANKVLKVMSHCKNVQEAITH